MQLVLLILGAFGLGYWFASSNAADRLAKTARNTTNRLRSRGKTELADPNDV